MMTKNVLNKELLGYACKHAFLTPHKTDSTKDLITAKVTKFWKDGTSKSLLITRENYKRPYYIVKEKYRKFKDKKDYIDIQKCIRYETNESNLAVEISKKLHGHANNADLNKLRASPYVFGIQTPAVVNFKQEFYNRYKEVQTGAVYTVGAYDVETDIVSDGEDDFGPINMASITCNDRVFWCGRRDFFKNAKSDGEIIINLRRAITKYLDQDYIKKHNVKFEFKIVETETEVVENCIRYFHIYSPDYIVSWNANFDMKRNELALRRGGINPEDVYSDPKIPKEYRGYEYYPGREKKIKANGDITTLRDYEKFPVLRAPASWQWFDGMSFYAMSRQGAGKLDSYKLQNIAEIEGIKGKLYTEEGKHLIDGSIDWHRYMQKNHPYIYAMYNIQDNFVIEDLNRKTQDYSLTLPALISSSELKSYQSQPTLLSDTISFIALEHNKAWGVTSYKNKKDSKKLTKKEKQFLPPNRSNWIAILRPELTEENGVPLFEGLDTLYSRGYPNVIDVDITSGYPTTGVVMNVSNTTTMIEVCTIDGFDSYDLRAFGVNYASGVPSNACSLATAVYGLPPITEIKDFYLNTVLPYVKNKHK